MNLLDPGTPWPFDQPPDCATMTTTHVMHHRAVITRAYHDEEDHGWQFFSEHVTHTADMLIVALREIVAVDPSVTQIVDLPPGWMAWRDGPGAPWQQALQYEEARHIIVDWAAITSEADFYDTVLRQCGAPAWHGRNLDALADLWVTGGLSADGPPFAFGFFRSDSTPPDLTPFREAVLKIAAESIAENGGRYLPPPEEMPA